jgi:hypothetical protein
MPDTVTIALWALNVGHPLAGLDDFVALVDQRMAEAAGQGADLLMLPEYVSEHWLWFAPQPLARPAELDWMAEQAEEVLSKLAPCRSSMAWLCSRARCRSTSATTRPAGHGIAIGRICSCRTVAWRRRTSSACCRSKPIRTAICSSRGK